MTDWTKTTGIPESGMALLEAKRTLAVRRERLNKPNPPAELVTRMRNMEQAVECLEFLRLITYVDPRYFETTGTPTK